MNHNGSGNGDNHNVERQLGIVIGKLGAIEKRLDGADASRRVLHDQVNAVNVSVAGLTAVVAEVRRDIDEMKPAVADVATIKADVAEMKPEVDMVRNVKMKAAGAVIVLVAIGGVIGFVFTVFLVDPLKAWLGRLFP